MSTIPINYTGPIDQAQASQSQETQTNSIQTGASLLSSMQQNRLNQLTTMADKLNDEILKTTQVASTPVPVSGQPSVNMPGQHNWSNIPLNTTPMVGQRANKEKGIANAITGVANIVGAYETKKQNEKNKNLSIDIETLLKSQQGIESAQQVLQQDPTNKVAQAAKQKNTDLMNSILSDDKKRKQIGKAFDINFVDPSQNNKPEHAALKQATQSYAEQLQSKMPTQMGPNQIAQQKLGQLTQASEAITNQIKAVTADRTTEALIRAETESNKLEERQSEEQDKLGHWNQQAQLKSQEFGDRLKQQAQIAQLLSNTRLGAAAIASNARLNSIQKAIDGRLQYADKLGLTGSKSIGVLNTNIQLYQKALQQMPMMLNQAQILYNDPKSSPQDKENLQKYINTTEQLQDSYREAVNQDQLKLSVLMDTGDSNASGSNNNQSKSQSNTNSTDKPGVKTSPAPIVKSVGPKSDSDDTEEHLKLLKDLLGNG